MTMALVSSPVGTALSLRGVTHACRSSLNAAGLVMIVCSRDSNILEALTRLPRERIDGHQNGLPLLQVTKKIFDSGGKRAIEYLV
jgi:hypothetical protein